MFKEDMRYAGQSEAPRESYLRASQREASVK